MTTKATKPKKLQGKPEDLVFLVVDDDGQVRDILTGYLRSFGFKNVREAKDGKTALKVVQDHQQKLDIIISDWEMPHIDGLTLLRAVRKDPFRESVKFLMVSSQSSRERIKISEAAKAYVDAYVVKPFRASVLKEKISNLIEQGFDPSAKDFDSELGAVHHNDEVFANPSSGNVIVIKKDTSAKTGHVTSAASGGTADVGKVIDASIIDGEHAPPDQYDLNQMNLDLILKLAAAYEKVKWMEKAIKLCTEALTIFPNSPDLYYQLALAYYNQGNWEMASANLKETVRIKPYHVQAQTLISEIAIKKIG